MLKDEFSKKGEHFKKVKSTNDYYVYERTLTSGNKCYEVFKRRDVAIGDFYRKFDTTGKYDGFDRMEAYPTNEQFGVFAYCCMTLEDAIKRGENRFKNINIEPDDC